MHIIWSMAGVACAGLMAFAALAQDYPARPIRIVTSPIGGGNDFMSRLIAQGIAPSLGQPVIVDNRGSSVIPAQVVAQALPDGYTLLFASNSLWTTPLLQKVPYDAVKDFAPVSMIDRAPAVLVLHPSVRANSVAELISYAKSRPGELNYSSAGNGTTPHLAAELFQSMAGVKMVHVIYSGGGARILNALLGGEVQVMFSPATLVGAHLKSNKLKPLAITSAVPSQLLPGIPTIAASGLPGYDAGSVDGVFTRAGTASTTISRLNREIVRFLNQPEVKEKFLNLGVEVVGSSSDEFVAYIRTDILKLEKVIKDAGIKAD